MRSFIFLLVMLGGIAAAAVTGWLEELLIVTGIGTLIVLTVPSLVVLGLFLAILPGLLLMLTPNVFLWSALFALAFYPLQGLIGDIPAAAAAAAFTAAVLYAIPARAIAESKRRFDAFRLPDVIPAEPIRLEGDILLDQPSTMSRRRPMVGKDSNDPRQRCTSLCAAMLFTDGVTSVSVIDGTDPPETFRLRRSSQCSEPVALPSPEPLSAALGVDWAARVERGLCIDRDAGAATDPALRIEICEQGERGSGKRWSFGPFGVTVKRLEVWRGDELLLRRSAMESRRTSSPLHVSGEGSIENFSAGWGREMMKDGLSIWNFKVHELLAEHSSLRTEVSVDNSRDEARGFIAEALADPSRPLSNAVASMVPAYFGSFSPFVSRDARGRGRAAPVTDADVDLLKGMLEDPRFTNFERCHDLIAGIGERIVELRDPLVARLLVVRLDGEGRDKLYGLDSIFSRQPDGAFATLTKGEEALLSDRERRGILGNLIVRLSDQGAAAVPRLLAMLRESLEVEAELRSQRKRGYTPKWVETTIHSCHRALRWLGPEAAPALPEIERMIAEGLYRPHALNDRSFHMLLARLGKPIEEIAKPQNLSGTEEAFHDRLRVQLARYGRDRDR